MTENQENLVSPTSDSSVPVVDAREPTGHVRMNSSGSECGSESIDLPTPPPFVDTQSQSAQATSAYSMSRSSSDVELKRPTPVVCLPSARLSERMRMGKLNTLFQLPSDEEHIDDWSAAMSKSILVQGRLYLFTSYLCFFSKLFGDDSREVIKLSEVAQMSKKRNGIEILTQTGDRFFFTSFITRTKAFNAMLKAWERATMSSDSTDTADKKNLANDDKTNAEAGSVCDLDDDEGIVVDMKADDSAEAPVVLPKSDEPVAEQSPAGETPLEIVASSGESASDKSLSEKVDSEKVEGAQESQNKDDDSKGSKGSDSGEPQMSVRDDNLMHIWDPPPESTIHHDDVGMFETHHDHFDRVDLLQFFHLFYSDASGDFAENAHKALEEFDLVTEPWTEKEDGGKQRLLQFNSVLHGIPIGPNKTRMTELQWYALNTDKLVVLTVQNSLDVPYGDYFDVENCWEFARSLRGGVDVSIKAGVHWKRKTWLKSQVESTTLKKCKECHIKWCNAIKEYMSYHMDQLGKRLVPYDAKAGAASEKMERNICAIRRRKHKHKHHHKGDGTDSVPCTPREPDSARHPGVSPLRLDSLQDSVNDNNGPRPKLVIKKESTFSGQHLLMMAVWLLTVLYLVARIMALERDVERLMGGQSPPSPPSPSSSSLPPPPQ